jgi:hypothetical protein
MHCPYCNKSHRSLLDPDGGDSCDPYAPGSVKMPLNLEELEADIRKIQQRRASRNEIQIGK